jgi:hypothetical protein
MFIFIAGYLLIVERQTVSEIDAHISKHWLSLETGDK